MSRNNLSGMGVSPGIAIGEPVVHETLPISTVRISIPRSEVEVEVERFRRAVTTAVERIKESQDRASMQMGEEYAGIFEAHRLIASDPSFRRMQYEPDDLGRAVEPERYFARQASADVQDRGWIVKDSGSVGHT